MLCYFQMIETPEDQTKFEVLYLEYKGLMYHVAFGILNNEQDAEDAVHQAFVKVAENMEKVDEPVSVKTKSYLVTIVENISINVWSFRSRHTEVPVDDNNVGLMVEYRGPDGLALCMSKLSPRYREVLTLKYHHGFDNKEIAKMLGVSYDNVRKLEQRARDRLLRLCKEEELL